MGETDASGGKRAARRDPSGAVYYYFEDHLGTSRVIVQAGQTAACYDADFYPFGGERPPYVNTCPQNYKFTGKERDSESGNDYFIARYYPSNLARFMSPDWSASPTPVPYADFSNPQSLNLYAYVLNNPLRYHDPSGHFLAEERVRVLWARIANGLIALLRPEPPPQPAQQQNAQQNTNGPFIAQDPQKYIGTVVGNGQCVAFVKADTNVPRQTKDWAPGEKVSPTTPPGAAIATFGPDGKYQNISGKSHAADLAL